MVKSATTTAFPPKVPKRLVETLRKQGIKVKIEHWRWAIGVTFGLSVRWLATEASRLVHVNRQNRGAYHIYSNGGETRVSLLFPDGRVAEGRAVCSREDTYHKRLGVYLAVQRATAAAKATQTEQMVREQIKAGLTMCE